jgi:cytochrome c-type biogenesis protein CcmH
VPAPAGPDPSAVVGAPRGALLTGEVLEAEMDRVASLLRCAVCQGLSVKDSPTGMAADMRKQVREMVAQGYDEEQVLSYFARSYGEFVRLRPRLQGVNWLVWLGPVAALAAGAFVVARVLRRAGGGVVSGGTDAGEPAPGRDRLPDDPALARFVRQVREEAYGWPDGLSPEGRSGDAPESR